MDKCNESVKCTVSNCRYHHDAKNYCTLQTVQIGTHEVNPTQEACTDCMSYVTR